MEASRISNTAPETNKQTNKQTNKTISHKFEWKHHESLTPHLKQTNKQTKQLAANLNGSITMCSQRNIMLYSVRQYNHFIV